ncbi:hypothetical protein ACPW7J_09575 [Ihubacter sp. rT4E-8]|uniref:hypothetical protein n=1 Tax=Ihubacter sp. rT4E-8 TaxID=3242369 RepID=UPI003CF7E482
MKRYEQFNEIFKDQERAEDQALKSTFRVLLEESAAMGGILEAIDYFDENGFDKYVNWYHENLEWLTEEM